MKLGKYLVFIILALLSNKAIASPVDSTRALNYAIEFFKSKISQSSNARISAFEFELIKKEPYVSSVGTANARINSSQEEFLYYIFNVKNNGGFIIISGDDAAEPVLAYSLEGNFDINDDNPGIKFFLQLYNVQLTSLKKNKIKYTEINNKWTQSISTRNSRLQTSTTPLFQNYWGQNGNGIYNKNCPNVSNGSVTKKGVVGCTAVSMAQIIKYYNFSGNINGSTKYKKQNGVNNEGKIILDIVKEDISNVNINTSLIPTSEITTNNTQIVKDEIAKLMYNCGITAGMEYKIGEPNNDPKKDSKLSSGAAIEDAKKAYINFFKMSSEMKLIEPEINTHTWSQAQIDAFKSELDEDRPVHFAGYYCTDNSNTCKPKDTGGHSFVMVAYDSDNKFKFNFGWGSHGASNGWYSLSNINTNNTDANQDRTGEGKGTYSLYQKALIGIKPIDNNCSKPVFEVRNFSPVNSRIWYEKYVTYLSERALIKYENNIFNADKNVTNLEAAKTVLVAANYLGIPNFQFADYGCNSTSPDMIFLEHLRNRGIISEGMKNNPNSLILFGDLCKIIDMVLINGKLGDFPVYPDRQLSKVSTSAPKYQNIINVVKVKSILKSSGTRNSTERLVSGFTAKPIDGAEIVTRKILAKFLANTVAAYKYQNNLDTYDGEPLDPNLLPFVGSDNPSDYTELGDKFEIEAPISGTEIPSVTSPTLTLNGGEVRSFSSANLTHDGLPLHFYWTVDGGTIEKMTDNFSKIKFTAPYVTGQKKIQLYFYTASAGGYAIEAFRTIIVNPVNVNFSINSTATNICSGEPITLTASGCSGTLQWNENLGNQATLTIRPTSTMSYYADCLYSGTSKRSNSISVTVKPGPTIAPKIENNYSQINRGESVVLIASGCPTGTNYYWKDFSAWDRITFYPTESDTYTAYCTLNGCNGPEAQTIVNVLDINCEIGEPNNSASSAYTLFEFKDKLVSTKLINGEEYPEYLGLGRFCIKNPTDNVDWYKIKIHEKWYYLKISINGNNCPECIYKLRFQVDGGLLTIYSYLYTNGETAKVEVYDSNTTALLASQNFNSSTEHELQVNICKSMPVPLIDFSQLSLNNLYTCHPNYFGLHVTHPIYEMGKGNLNSVAYNIGFSWSENMDGSNELNEGTYYFTPNLNSQKTYYVRGSDRNTPGCIGETALPITVYPNQSPSTPIPTVTVSKTEVSLGESIILKATGCPSIVKWNALPILVQDNITAEVQYGEEIIYKPVLRSFDTQISNTYYARCITETCIGSGGGSPRVTVYRINKPIISSDKTIICPNETINLMATGCSGGTITWNNDLGIGTSKTVNPSITTTYSATCTLSGATTDFADGVTVFVNNYSGGSISPLTQNLCQNINSSTNRLLDQPLTLSTYIGNILRWEYKPPNGTWTDWGQAGIESPSNCCFGTITGTWKVRAVIGDGVCQSTNSTEASIIVLPLPSSPAISAGPLSIVSGQSSTLSASNCSGTVTWSNSLGTGTSKTVSPPSTTTYTATCTVNGCTSTNGSVTVTVSTCNLSAPTTTSSNRCGSGTLTLSASGCSGGIYAWYLTNIGGDFLFASNNSTFTTPLITSTTNYYVECFLNNCTSARTVAIATIKAIPTAPTLSASPANISPGQSSTLSASNCSGAVTWSNSLGTGTSKSVSPTVTTTYTATCTVNGCTSSISSTIVSITVQSISFTNPTGGTYSSGQSVPITYTSSNGIGTVNLELVSCVGTTSLGTISTSSAASGTINYAIPGSLVDGSYRIKAYTSSSPANAYYSSCFNYYACGSFPDIIISDVAITKYAANRVNYAVTFKNTSISPASLGSVSLGVFASPDALKNSNDIFKSAIFAGGGTLQPGQTYVINDFSSFNFTDPNYYLGFSIDYHGLLTECYENNNDFIKLINKCNASGTDIVLGFLSDPFYAFNGTVIVPSTNQYTTPKMIVARAFKVNPTTNLTNLSLVVGNCLTLPSGARIGVNTPIEEKHVSLGNFDFEYNSLKITEVRNEVVNASIWDIYNNQLIKVVTRTEIQDLEKLELKTGKYLLRLESPTLMEGFVFER